MELVLHTHTLTHHVWWHHTFYRVTSNINLVTDNAIGWINNTANKLNTPKKTNRAKMRALFVTLAAVFRMYLSTRFATATYFDGIISIHLIEWEFFPPPPNICIKSLTFLFWSRFFNKLRISKCHRSFPERTVVVLVLAVPLAIRCIS